MTESAGGSPRFDPRFDPAYQPGYDPKTDGRPDQREQPRTSEPRIHETETPQIGGFAPSAASPEIRDVALETAASRRINPFLIAIWVVSVLFIAAGLALLTYIGDRLNALNTSGGGASTDYYLLNSYSTGAPLLVVLGLATATGSLFLLANRYARRPTERRGKGNTR